MPMTGGKYASPTWKDNAPPELDAIELQAITDTVEKIDGGAYTKAEMLSDATKMQAGLMADSVPNDMFAQQLNMLGSTDIVTAGLSVRAGDFVDVENGVTSFNMHIGDIGVKENNSAGGLESSTLVGAGDGSFIRVGKQGQNTILYFYRVIDRVVKLLGSSTMATDYTSIYPFFMSKISNTKYFVAGSKYKNQSYLIYFTVVANESGVYTNPMHEIVADMSLTSCIPLPSNRYLFLYMNSNGSTSHIKIGTLNPVVESFTFGNTLDISAVYVEVATNAPDSFVITYSKPNSESVFYRVVNVVGDVVSLMGEMILKTYPATTYTIQPKCYTVSGYFYIKTPTEFLLCERIGDTLSIIDTMPYDITGKSDIVNYAVSSDILLCEQAQYKRYLVYIRNKKIYRTRGTEWVPDLSYLSDNLVIQTTSSSGSSAVFLNVLSITLGNMAVALKDAQENTQVPISYAGQAYLAGAVKGKTKYSSGVSTYAYKDNFISVKGFW